MESKENEPERHKPVPSAREHTSRRAADGLRRNARNRASRLAKFRGGLGGDNTSRGGDGRQFSQLLAAYQGKALFSPNPEIASKALDALVRLLQYGGGTLAEAHYGRLLCPPNASPPKGATVVRRLCELLGEPAAAERASLALLSISAYSDTRGALLWIKTLLHMGFLERAVPILQGKQATVVCNVLWTLSNIGLESQECRDALFATESLMSTVATRLERVYRDSPAARAERWETLPQLLKLANVAIVPYETLPPERFVTAVWAPATFCLLQIEPFSDDPNKAESAQYALEIVRRLCVALPAAKLRPLLEKTPALVARLVHVCRAAADAHFAGTLVVLTDALYVLRNVEFKCQGASTAASLQKSGGFSLLTQLCGHTNSNVRRLSSHVLSNVATDGWEYVRIFCSTDGVLASILPRQLEREQHIVRRNMLYLLANCVETATDAPPKYRLLPRLVELGAVRHLCDALRLVGEEELWVVSLRALGILCRWNASYVRRMVDECDGVEAVESALSCPASEVFNAAEHLIDHYLGDSIYREEQELDAMQVDY